MSRFLEPRFVGWIVPALMLIAGCTQEHSPTSMASAPMLSIRESRTLCLATVAGDTQVEQGLRRAQAMARQLPDHAEYWVAAGRGWVRKARLSADPGFYLNVDGCAGEALQANPEFVPALELRGLVLMNNHQFESARALAEQILKRAPDSVIADGTLSDALLELGRYQEAAQAAQAQMNVHPGMAVNARAAHLNWLKGDTRSAKLFIRDALMDRNADDPESAAWTFVEAGMIYWHQGDYDGADAIFSEALKWVPDYPAALVGRGRVALARGQASAAIADLAKAQMRRPLVETAWLLGDAYTMAGDGEHARQAYGEAERQGRRGDKFTLALFLASKGEHVDEALRLLEEERRNRGGIYVDDAYAWALYRSGRFDEAQRFSAQALRLGTRDARLLYHAGAIEIALGDRASGRRLLTQALALNPGFDFTGAAEARKLLAPTSMRLAGN
jgi:tetratricopeptide (TPR) repeat protein